MKRFFLGLSSIGAGVLAGYLAFSLFLAVADEYRLGNPRFYQDRRATANSEEFKVAKEFGFEPENEVVAESLALKNLAWSRATEACGEPSAGENLYIQRAIVWGQADKLAAGDSTVRLTGVSDFAHITRGQIDLDNPECGRGQNDAVAFLVSERNMDVVLETIAAPSTEPLQDRLKQIDGLLLSRIDAWIKARTLTEPCTNLRDPEYFQCGGLPGVLFAYRAALLGSVMCSTVKSDAVSIAQLNEAWDLAIWRSAAINKHHYEAARTAALERLQTQRCSDLPFWLSAFEY
jgi:hypothetical protein